MSPRVRAFIVVGFMGFVVQAVALVALQRAGVPLVAATALAVEAAVLSNFASHVRWTWRDRVGGEANGWVVRLLRFHSSAALISLGANVALTWIFVRQFHLPLLVANALSVGIAAAANYVAADRWVFAPRRDAAPAAAGLPVATLALAVCLQAQSVAAKPSSETLAAWQEHVSRVEAQQQTTAPDCTPGDAPTGDSVRVTGGTIYRWSGCTRVRNLTVRDLVDTLVKTGTPPPQDDVLEARVLQRTDDHLQVYLRLIRRSLVTVAYDTEHEMTFHRVSNRLATSRSVATRIQEADGGDHGFLWQWRSYWRYEQAGPDVRIELVSLTLSRDVPALVRPVAAPVINSVARDAMGRTLEALRSFFETPRPGKAATLPGEHPLGR